LDAISGGWGNRRTSGANGVCFELELAQSLNATRRHHGSATQALSELTRKVPTRSVPASLFDREHVLFWTKFGRRQCEAFQLLLGMPELALRDEAIPAPREQTSHENPK
jgi:hypothetical protein